MAPKSDRIEIGYRQLAEAELTFKKATQALVGTVFEVTDDFMEDLLLEISITERPYTPAKKAEALLRVCENYGLIYSDEENKFVKIESEK